MVGNWKMNHSLSEINAFFNDLNLDGIKCETWIAPQALHISGLLLKAAGTPLKIGAQNIATELSGAHTGEISAQSVKDLGASFALVGHSERRSLYNEDHNTLNKKLLLNDSLGMTTIFCIGEQLEERENGMTDAVLKHQLQEGLKGFPKTSLERLIIAYEPVWAIGTGKVATPEQAEETHYGIRSYMVELYGREGSAVPLLYGGSVKPDNAEGLLSQNNIDGALVGGASLKGKDFSDLARTASTLA
jgi:triosephosphate isomerase (TIM)